MIVNLRKGLLAVARLCGLLAGHSATAKGVDGGKGTGSPSDLKRWQLQTVEEVVVMLQRRVIGCAHAELARANTLQPADQAGWTLRGTVQIRSLLGLLRTKHAAGPCRVDITLAAFQSLCARGGS